jgi:hypothetical protein
MKLREAVFLFLILLMSEHKALAYELGFEGGMSMGNPGYQSLQSGNSVSYSSLSGFALVGFAVFGLSRELQIETGAMYLSRHFGTSDSMVPDVTVEKNYNSWVFPVILRWEPVPTVSLGAGLYYLIGTGQVGITRTLAGITGSSVVQDFNTDQGIGRTALGVTAGIRIAIPVVSGWSCLIDGRFLKDLSERYVGTSASLRFSDLQFLAGLALEF